MSDQETRSIESLKVLHDGGLSTLRTLSERSFTTTLQAITLDVAVVAGLIGSKAELSLTGKCIGSVLLLLFNGFIIGYLASKARAHHREKLQFVIVLSAIRQLSGLNDGNEESQVSFWRSFFGGSGLFIASIALAGAVAATALWVPMIKQSASALTPRSTRTPPALPSALSQHLASSTPISASVQARPLSFFR